MQMIDLGHFHSTKTSGLNFCQLEWNSIFLKFPKKKTTLARYTQIFEKILPRSFLSIQLCSWISRIFFDAISKILKVLVEYMESTTGVLTICMEKPVILGRTQMEWFILADEKFQYHLSTTTSARLIPGRLQCPRWTVQVMKHCRSKTIIL